MIVEMAPGNSRSIELKNPHIKAMDRDMLYHLGFEIESAEDLARIQEKFGDVRIFLLGGTRGRMRKMADYLRKSHLPGDGGEPIVDLCEKVDRYAMFKVGPVLCCSHGIGMSTFSVLLHELLKLAYYAKCEEPVFIRIGTCGGLGVEPGTVVVTEHAYNGLLRNEYEIFILGKRIVRPATFDLQLSHEILKCAEPSDDFHIIKANTLATDCFYEGQGRLDGASCDYGQDEKRDFLKKCIELGIRNIEMEATMFASLTRHVGVRAADMCVTLLDRLVADQISVSIEKKKEFEVRPIVIAGRFVQRLLNQVH